MLRVRLHHPDRIYSGTQRRSGQVVADWPPSPWRIVAALTSGAHALNPQWRDAALAVLDRVSHTDPPVWHLPSSITTPLPSVWVPATDAQAPTRASSLRTVLNVGDMASGADDTRSKQQATWLRVELAHPCAFLDIALPVTPSEAKALAAAAQQVSYVGRAEHPAMLGVLTPDSHGNWRDHTAPGGRADTEQHTPTSQHHRWLPDQPGGTSLRCWNPDMLAVLTADHQRRYEHGQLGVPDHLKGRDVPYAPVSERAEADGWVALPLARPTWDVVRTLAAIPAPAGAVLPLLYGRRLVGLLCRDTETVTILRRHHQSWLAERASVQRTRNLFCGAARRWRSATPVVAHADRHVATAELASELADRDCPPQHLRVRPSDATCPVPGRAAWHTEMIFPEPVSGPLRIGHAAEYGCGMNRPAEDRR